MEENEESSDSKESGGSEGKRFKNIQLAPLDCRYRVRFPFCSAPALEEEEEEEEEVGRRRGLQSRSKWPILGGPLSCLFIKVAHFV